MIREDFVLRLIRQIVLLVLGSRRQREEGQLEQALDDLDEGSRRLIGLDTRVLSSLTLPVLLSMLTHEGEPDRGRIASAALLLRERAAIRGLLGHPQEQATLRARASALLAAARDGATGEVAAELEALERERLEPGPEPETLEPQGGE